MKLDRLARDLAAARAEARTREHAKRLDERFALLIATADTRLDQWIEDAADYLDLDPDDVDLPIGPRVWTRWDTSPPEVVSEEIDGIRFHVRSTGGRSADVRVAALVEDETRRDLFLSDRIGSLADVPAAQADAARAARRDPEPDDPDAEEVEGETVTFEPAWHLARALEAGDFEAAHLWAPIVQAVALDTLANPPDVG